MMEETLVFGGKNCIHQNLGYLLEVNDQLFLAALIEHVGDTLGLQRELRDSGLSTGLAVQRDHL